MLFIYVGGGVLCFYVLSSLSDIRGRGLRSTLLIVIVCLSFSKLTYLGDCGWKWVELCIYILNGFIKGEMRGEY